MARAPQPKAQKRRMSAEERRENFLDAAHTIIRDEGLERLTMESIAAHVGVNKALPYRHFDNRDHVLAALYDRIAARLDEAVAAELEGVSGLDNIIGCMVKVWVQFMERGDDLPILMQARTQNGELEAARERRVDLVVDVITEMIVEERGLRRPDAKLAASILLASAQGMVAVWQSKTVPTKRLIETFIIMAKGSIDQLCETRGTTRKG